MMATPAFKFHSPLESLVRRTSSRSPDPSQPVYPPVRSPPHTDSQFFQNQSNYAYQQQETPPRLQSHRAPASPLLHSHFARDSTATASSNDNNSYLGSSRTSVDSRNIYPDPELQYRYYDDDSIYSSNTGPALRDSWQSGATTGTVRDHAFNLGRTTPIQPNYDALPSPVSPTSPVPTVIVSSPTDPDAISEYAPRAGRAPVVRPITSNFSRPVRPMITTNFQNEEQKRKVLERNVRRAASPHDSPHQTSRVPASPEMRRAQSNPYSGNSVRSIPTSNLTPNERSKSPIGISGGRTRSPSPHRAASPAFPSPSNGPGMVATRSLSPSMVPASKHQLNRPPSIRAGSPVSLYSTYSFYQLDSASPSPTGGVFPNTALDSSSFTGKPRAAPSPPSQSPMSEVHVPSNSGARTPQEYLQLGIQHHEANRLKESAVCFEKSAKENGGCGVGMLMWGLALRHGWGCEKDEKSGFKWLRRAAESAVEDLEHARAGGGVDSGAIQTELVLAIYEVGQCFFQGWGVPKDQKMAVSYYTVAARLGDADAQIDLAFCLNNGKGCKKDRKEAAKWYRAAVAQGQSDIGLAWIYKEKYQ